MTRSFLCILLAVTGASALSVDEGRPVTKVIQLLEDMMKTLQNDADEDQKIFEKMACWCKTNDKATTEGIKKAEGSINELTSNIEEGSATKARLSTEIDITKKEVEENQAALDQAIQLRKEQLAEFNAEEKDMLESIRALKSAVTVLSKHHGGSFLQTHEARLEGIAASIQNVMQLHSTMLMGALTKKDRDTVIAFAQNPVFGDSSYSSQSGEIFGILQTMLENFQKNLDQSQKEEASNSRAFDDLKKAKEEEIQAAVQQLNSKKEEHATTATNLAEDKVELENTKATLSSDEQFLMDLKKKCQMTDQEWEARQKTRTDEIAAVSKAIEILSSDEAHAHFSHNVNKAEEEEEAPLKFIQTGESDNVRSKASSLLQQVAGKTGNPRLSNLAVRVKLDAFTKVKKAIDDMINALLKQKEDEIKKRDYCIKAQHEREVNEGKKQDEKLDAKTKKEDLIADIDAKQHNIVTLKQEIAEIKEAVKEASEERGEQNKEFKKVIAESRGSQLMLKRALESLAAFYKKPAAFVQVSGPPAPAGFDEYKHNAASGNVMGMLRQILADEAQSEKESTRDEAEQQKAYEDFVQKSNANSAQKGRSVTDLSEAKAKSEQHLSETEDHLDDIGFSLSQLANLEMELEQECKFTLKNFDVRQDARDEEVQALRQAKAILSGDDFSAFLQHRA